MNIIWTLEALKTFESILDYLENEFSKKQRDKFYFICDDVIELIQSSPFLYKPSGKNNVRQAVIHKYTTLYFEINQLNNTIILLSFFDTRQNPSKKNFY